ncbi:hypothetical protein [Novosphingobium lindaniclasticum]|jgi:hypothetical protein|uniref:hypothetical protein n=1 Tax=Novosphingobium lindaniclasticum TaxID=1329895 RepID=UPI0024096560|nr:hypothetical protein [Novosphingobium lindaniclasticum]
MKKRIISLMLWCMATLISSPSYGQNFDPRTTLGQMISAFQMCGPPQAYQMLSPALFKLVAMQTGGSGCYSAIASAGPITGMQVLQSQQFPVGPLYSVRVSHQSGSVIWLIGFNKFTNKIEYLNFQPDIGVNQASGDIRVGLPSGQGPSTDDEREPNPNAEKSECQLYPAMCP